MKSPFMPDIEHIINTYCSLKNFLRNDQQYIFTAMHEVRPSFVLPIGPEEYASKHNEIESMFKYAHHGGLETFYRLVPHVYHLLKANAGYNSRHWEEYLRLTRTSTHYPGIVLAYHQEDVWVALHEVHVKTSYEIRPYEIPLFLYSDQLEEIVPTHTVELLSSSIKLYRQEMYMPATILATVALESTLRKALELRGYTSNIRGNIDDDHEFVSARLGVMNDETGYTLHLDGDLSHTPTEFRGQFGDEPQYLRVKRKYRTRQQGREMYDVILRDADDCLQYLTTEQVQRPAQKVISGLGMALKIARERENILTPEDLPVDMDEVFKGVRNNLIHISEESLAAEISGSVPLGDILADPLHVYDIISNVPDFINKQCLKIHRDSLAPTE